KLLRTKIALAGVIASISARAGDSALNGSCLTTSRCPVPDDVISLNLPRNSVGVPSWKIVACAADRDPPHFAAADPMLCCTVTAPLPNHQGLSPARTHTCSASALCSHRFSCSPQVRERLSLHSAHS